MLAVKTFLSFEVSIQFDHLVSSEQADFKHVTCKSLKPFGVPKTLNFIYSEFINVKYQQGANPKI